jgi:hypothetical protein
MRIVRPVNVASTNRCARCFEPVNLSAGGPVGAAMIVVVAGYLWYSEVAWCYCSSVRSPRLAVKYFVECWVGFFFSKSQEVVGCM